MFAGNVVFHGPRENVVPHFQSLGFFVPERKAVSDFLQEVTSRKDQQVSAEGGITCVTFYKTLTQLNPEVVVTCVPLFQGQ